MVAEQLRICGVSSAILLEPVGRNTAPAVALLPCMHADGSDPLLLVLPADHVIQDENAFARQWCQPCRPPKPAA